MDKSAGEITFNEFGVCNFCFQAAEAIRFSIKDKWHLNELIEEIRKKAEKYDALIGLSGGVDSSMTLHCAVQLGLKVLTFTIDNGYNDPRADENILRMVEKLKVPFYRYTIDLNKFKELQSAFMRAGLINIEIPTDHILMAASYEMAEQYNIKYILSGGNVSTESIMPASWSFTARDLTHIKDVYKKMTKKKLAGLPLCGLLKWNYYRWVKNIKIIYLLDYLDYNRKKSEIMLIKNKYGFQSTGEKHEENIFTKWFQNFYLFEKFNIDKRKAHLSSLIHSDQITREEALFELEKNPIYPLFGIEKKVMTYPKHSHYDFKTDKWFNRISKIVRIFR